MYFAILLALAFALAPMAPAGVEAASLDTHPLVLDASGRLLSWVSPQDKAYDRVMFRSWGLLEYRIPIDPASGLRVFYTHCDYEIGTLQGTPWPNNPAGKTAMLADAADLYYAYSGDRGVIELVCGLLDHCLAHGLTPADADWARVPWSTAAAGSVDYGDDAFIEGVGVLEPDKVGELGYHGFLRFYELTGEPRYRDAAIDCANALAAHVRPGNAEQSPWPFRIRAETGALAGEDYCADVIAPIQLFDELIRLGLGDVAAYRAARQLAWDWLMSYPMTNQVWASYFEDIRPQANLGNLNQYVPGQTARYLLQHPQADSLGVEHARALIDWIAGRFGGTDRGEPGLQYGARVISEQDSCKFKMASHTARWGAINALYAEATGDTLAREQAFRALNWCTYMSRDDGVVIEGPAELIANPNCWYTDGHGDYIRHFMLALGAMPEWAPAAENHLLRSSSAVPFVSYGTGSIVYATFDSAATEVLRLTAPPRAVLADGEAMERRGDLAQPGWTFDDASRVLRVRHDAATQLEVVLSAPPPNVSPVAQASVTPAGGTAPLVVEFSAAGSADADGDSLSYGWTFSDGATASGRTVARTLATPGTYSGVVWVNDGHGNTARASAALRVSEPLAFPQTPVLDHFLRADGSLGGEWIDQTARFSVASGLLVPSTGAAYVEWGAEVFAPEQEAYVTLSALGPQSHEHNLMLKTQGSSWTGGHIEVSYSHTASRVTVSSFTPPGSWTAHGTLSGVSFAAGDQFGARARADGMVQVFRNGILIGGVSAARSPYAALSGRIGISVADATQSRFDAFGGGDVTARVEVGEAGDSPAGGRAALSLAYPNPTRGGIRMQLALPAAADVRFRVIDVLGRTLWSAPPQRREAGRWSLEWDGRSAAGAAASGVYFGVVRAGQRQFIRRFAVVR